MSGHFVLDLGGETIALSGVTANTRVSSDSVIHNIATFSFNPGALGQSPSFLDWIARFIKGFKTRPRKVYSGSRRQMREVNPQTPHDFTLHHLDTRFRSKNQIEFLDAYIKEISMPKLDAKSKDPVSFTVKVDGHAKYLKGMGEEVRPAKGAHAHKTFLCSNFRVEIGGLDTSRVSSVGPLVFKGVGAPELVLGVDLKTHSELVSWDEDLLTKRKDGTLALLDLHKIELLTLSFHQMVLVGHSTAGSEGKVRLRAASIALATN